MENNITFSTREFAELVNREPRTIYTWIRQGRLIPKKDFRSRLYFTPEDYEKVMGKPLVLDRV